jgi:hypothetical protein
MRPCQCSYRKMSSHAMITRSKAKKMASASTLRDMYNALKAENEQLRARIKSLEPARRDFSKMGNFLSAGEPIYMGSVYTHMWAHFTLNVKGEPVIAHLGKEFKSPSEFCQYHAKFHKKNHVPSEEDWHAVKLCSNSKTFAEVYKEGIEAGY